MRPFAFAFIVYILVLTVQPCKDFAALADADSAGRASIAGISDMTVPNGETCSPFCACSCCQPAVAFKHPAYSIPEFASCGVHRPRTIEYQNPNLRAFSTPIWQPPRLIALG